MSVTVRRAVVADAFDLAALSSATFGLACPPGTTQEDIDAFIGAHLSQSHFDDYLRDADRELWIVDADGVPVGYSMLVYAEPSDAALRAQLTASPTAELSKVYLLEGLHGTGAASSLMAATIAAARQRAVAGVWLGVNAQNERANRFYEKSGFSAVGSRQFRVGAELHDDFVRELVF